MMLMTVFGSQQIKLLNQTLAPGGGGDNDGDGDDGAIVNDEAGETGLFIADLINPDLKSLLDDVKVNATELGALLGPAISGLSAKVFVSADVPVLISNDALGGSWTFNANASLTTSLNGLHDPIEFDVDSALQALETAYDSSQLSTGTATESEIFELTGGLFLTINPDGSTEFTFSNNSGTITRAAQITELSIGYSRKIWNKNDNGIYVGIRPKYYSIGLTNKFIFIDNIENVKDIFDAIDKDNFHYTEKLSMDIGTIWTGKQYQLGATLTNINEPDFDYPDIDTSRINNPDIVSAINERQTYTMERQLKLEGGYVSKNGAWGINAGLDVNAVLDPIFDEYQWVSIGAGFASDNWWLPGARVGVRKNLVGTEYTYVTAGITVFNIVNLDLATTTQTIEVDGDTLPNGLIVNIGAQILF